MTEPQISRLTGECLAGWSGCVARRWRRMLSSGGRNLPVDSQTYLSCQAVANLRIFPVAQEIQAKFAGGTVASNLAGTKPGPGASRVKPTAKEHRDQVWSRLKTKTKNPREASGSAGVVILKLAIGLVVIHRAAIFE